MRRRALFLPVTVAVIQIVGTHMAAWHQGVDLTAGTLALLLAGPVLLIFRRRSPGLTAAGCAAVALAHVVAGFPPGPFVVSMAIALVLALVSGARWWAWGSAAAFAAGAAGLFQWRGSPPLFSLIWLVVLLLGAELARAGRLHRIERHRAEAEQPKHHADQERLVIARDIHDVVAHSLSMINVQASVALHLAEKDLNPAKLLEALTNIKAGSAQSLNDVREVLSVLRQDAPRIPSQRLEQLPDLLAQLTGLQTHYSPPSSAPVWMDDAVENTIYRVVQESLTNVVRHAKASRVEVAVQLTETRAQVSVADDGIGLGPAQEGNGLRGLRERVQALGGTVTLSAGILPGTPGESMSIGVLIVDDQSLIRAGFSALLEAEADMSVLGTAGSGTEAVQLARATKPDVVLMDIRMPHGDGISATAQITADLPPRDHADHLRARRVHSGLDPRRSQRVPGERHRAGTADRGGAHCGGRRFAALAQCHPYPAEPSGRRDPEEASQRSAAGRADRPGARSAGADRHRENQRGDRS